MSWSSLKTTFSQCKVLKNTQTPKRKSGTHRTSFPVSNAKRPRLSAPLPDVNAVNSADSDESIEYDPDYDDYCNGCLNQTSKAILPLITCKSPNSKQNCGVRRTPFAEYNKRNDTDEVQPIQHQTPRKQRNEARKSNWNPLELTLREVQSEKLVLERSIAASDSDGNENDENSSEQFFIQTQSSGQSQDHPCSPAKLNNSHQKIQSPAKDTRSAINHSHIRDGARKVQCRKGGYVEKLRRVVNRQKSDFAFWYHARRSQLHPDGVLARIKHISNSYGRKMVTIVDEHNKEILVFAADNDKLKVGSKIYIDIDPHCYNVNGVSCYLGSNKIMNV